MSLFPQIHKQQDLGHCSQNSTKLQFSLYCPKCRADSKNRVKRWNNVRGLFYHLITIHQSDKYESPSLNDSVSWLQAVSDAVNHRWIK
jgi:hypothetical protein